MIANRGEIAVRIIRAARELGIRSVAVYSDADRFSAHVLNADEAHRIGPAPATESYLRMEPFVRLAIEHDIDAIHPGYGFLSERAEFATAVEHAGKIFVGPSPRTIEAMGDKTNARQTMLAAGVPVVPGSVGLVTSAEEAARAAAEVGYPTLLKAAAGGGGKGMRKVASPDQLNAAFYSASREASSAFGDGSLYVEHCLARPRHIEVQILGDAHGNVVHVGERDCSVQRRHQKMVEEAPAPNLTRSQRDHVCQLALKAARAVSYCGAGTVEFLFEDGRFYFLEMNTRIQVEHPVTEAVTGVDLVQSQLRVACGEELSQPSSLLEPEPQIRGHAIECRITAEDSAFLPSTGTIRELRLPGGPGIRWDGGVVVGQDVTLFYDSLLGKLIAFAPSRDLAIQRMRRALRELFIVGVETSAPFHRRLLQDPDFCSGKLSIRFLEEHPGLTAADENHDLAEVAALVASLVQNEATLAGSHQRIEPTSVSRPGWKGPC